MGLDFIGCEIDPEYYSAQEERFKQECMGVTHIGDKIITQYNLFNEDQNGEDKNI